MQISKSFIVCAVICLCPIFGRADTQAQIKAREALRQKIAESGGETTTNAVSKPDSTGFKSSPSGTAMKPDTKSQMDSEKRRRAQEALHQKMKEMESQPATASVQSPGQKDSEAVERARNELHQKMKEIESQPATASVQSPGQKDSEAVERARNELRKKMAEMNAQRPSEPVPPSAPVASKTKPAKPAPVKSTPVVTTKPAPEPKAGEIYETLPPDTAPVFATPTTSDPATAAKAQEELRRKIAELEAQAKTSQIVKPSPNAPEYRRVPLPPRSMEKETHEALERDRALAAEAKIMQEREARLAKERERAAARSNVKEPAKEDKRSSKERAEAEKEALKRSNPPAYSFDSPTTLAPAVSAAKAEKLAELLRKYKADELTPEQYHKERAKILSEPDTK